MSAEWTVEDDAEAAFEANVPPGHPARIVVETLRLLSDDPLDEDQIAAHLIGALHPWMRDYLAEIGAPGILVGHRAYRPTRAPDVAYVKLVPGATGTIAEPAREAHVWATLIWRPDLGGWLIQTFGDAMPIHLITTRRPSNEPPQYESDVPLHSAWA